MIIYLTAQYPFALKKNGKVLEYSAESSVAEAGRSDVFEVLPLAREMPRTFVANAEFADTSDERILKCDMGGCLFLHFLKSDDERGFAVLEQKRLGGALVTIYHDGGLKAAIESNSDFLLQPLAGTAAEACALNADGEFVLIGAEKRIMVFDVRERIKCVLDAAADEWSNEGGFALIHRHKDMAKHVSKDYFRFDGEKFTVEKSELSRDPRFTPEKLPQKLLPFAFAEALLTGDDPAPYLTESLYERSEMLKNYFGKFIGVFPPPTGYAPALVYERAKNVYYCKYLLCEFAGRKITNFRLSEKYELDTKSI